MKDNLHYFKTSINNPEGLDERYIFIEKDKNIDCYVEVSNKFKELLKQIKNKKNAGEHCDELYKKAHELFKNDYAKNSEFVCFVNACDSTFKTIKNDELVFKAIVDLYIEHRDYDTPASRVWIQALIDRGASRSEAHIGEQKLIEIAKQFGFVHVDNWADFHKNKKAVAVFSKNKFNYPEIEKQLGVSFKNLSQGKLMDIILKNDCNYMFVEAKHIKQEGGAQNKQIKELIELLNQSLDNAMIGAFLDGVRSNLLLKLSENDIENPSKTNNKLSTQQYEIIETLKKYKNSFWFNTQGFTEWIKDFS